MTVRIDHTRVQELISEGAQLIEVLPEPEYTKLHLPDAVSKPLKEFDKASVDDLVPTRATIVYCWDTQ